MEYQETKRGRNGMVEHRFTGLLTLIGCRCVNVKPVLDLDAIVSALIAFSTTPNSWYLSYFRPYLPGSALFAKIIFAAISLLFSVTDAMNGFT